MGARRARLGGLGAARRQGPGRRGRGRGAARAPPADGDAQHGRPRRRHVEVAAREPLVSEEGARLLRDAAVDAAADVRAVRQRRVPVPGRLQEVRRAVAAGGGRVCRDGAPRGLEGEASEGDESAAASDDDDDEESRCGVWESRWEVERREGQEGKERVWGEKGEVKRKKKGRVFSFFFFFFFGFRGLFFSSFSSCSFAGSARGLFLTKFNNARFIFQPVKNHEFKVFVFFFFVKNIFFNSFFFF